MNNDKLIEQIKETVKTAGKGFSLDMKGQSSFESMTGTVFEIQPTGVFTKTSNNGLRAVCGPLEVIAETIDVDTGYRSRVVEGRASDGEPISEVIPCIELARSPKDVVSRLVAKGLHVPSLSSQGGNRYLIDYLNNHPVNVRPKGVAHVGWIKNAVGRAFMTPSGAIQAPDDMTCYIYQGNDEPELSGTFEEWSRLVASKAVYSSRLMFGLCVAFAPILQTITGEESRGFHFVGPTSKGKSTILRVAQSVWKGGNSIGSWRTTDNGAEGFASETSGMLLTLDEMKEARAESLEDMIYMLANETGKRRAKRSGDLRAVKKWKTFFLSTGELSAYDHATGKGATLMAGAEIRLVNIPACPSDGYGILDALPQGVTAGTVNEWVDGLNKLVKFDQYGTAGHEFVKRLIEHINAVGGLEAFKGNIKTQVDTWIKANANEINSEVARVARAVGLFAVTGELAIELDVLPWKPGQASSACKTCFESWLNEGFVSNEKRARDILDMIFQWANSNFARFHVYDARHTQALHGRASKNEAGVMLKELKTSGSMNIEEGQTLAVAIKSNVLNDLFRSLGLSKSDSINLLKEQKLSTINDNQRGLYKVSSGEKPSASFGGVMPVPAGSSGRYLVLKV